MPKTWFKGDLKPKPPGAITSVKISASRELANFSYETVNLIKRSVAEFREEADWRRRVKNTCDAHTRALCEQEDRREACYEQVTQSCFDDLGIENSALPGDFSVYLIHISFELIEDDTRRARFQSIPTKLQLPKEDVDMLIGVAPELLNENPEFRHLMRELNATVDD